MCLAVPAQAVAIDEATDTGTVALGNVSMVYSTGDAPTIARDRPDRRVVFLAIGCASTASPVVVAIRQARAATAAGRSTLGYAQRLA